MPSLNPIEQSRFKELEDKIESSLQSALEVGQALREINEAKYYRNEYRDFGTYCKDRWGMDERHGRRLIEFSKVCENIGPIGPILPLHESQIRPLSRLTAREQQEVWKEAVARSEQQPTAKLVKEVADEFYPPPEEEERFDIFEESTAVYQWLLKRRETWPEKFRCEFALMVRTCIERMEAQDDAERRIGFDTAKAG